jgi:hypothetical protein
MKRQPIGARSTTTPIGYHNRYGQFVSTQGMTIGQMIQLNADENDRDVIC